MRRINDDNEDVDGANAGYLYRYWWVLLGVAVLAVSGGGGEK